LLKKRYLITGLFLSLSLLNSLHIYFKLVTVLWKKNVFLPHFGSAYSLGYLVFPIGVSSLFLPEQAIQTRTLAPTFSPGVMGRCFSKSVTWVPESLKWF